MREIDGVICIIINRISQLTLSKKKETRLILGQNMTCLKERKKICVSGQHKTLKKNSIFPNFDLARSPLRDRAGDRIYYLLRGALFSEGKNYPNH